MPVRTISYDGDEKITNQLREISMDELDGTEFAIPEGYTKKTVGLPF